MANTTDILIALRLIGKLHENLLHNICEQYHLTMMEAKIISFLHNNPGHDTAGDIAELRMLSKGHVSQAVEQLIQKSVLQRCPDADDRRKIHLLLLPEAQVIADAMDTVWVQLQQEIFCGFSAQERETFSLLNSRIMENTRNAINRRK